MSGDSSTNFFELTEKAPSVYRIWQKVRAEGGTEGEMEDKYRALLDQYGHRDSSTAK